MGKERENKVCARERGEREKMVGRSHVVNINLNCKPAAIRISEFLSDLSMMDDDSKKVMKLGNFICSLEDEIKKIDGSQHEFSFSMLFLNEAIAKFKKLKMVCEAQAASKGFIPCKGIFDEDARAEDIPVINDEKKDWLSSAKLWSTNAHFDNHQDDEEVNNVSDGLFDNFQERQNGNEGAIHMNLDQKCSDPSIHGGISVSSAPMIQFEPISFNPGEKCGRNISSMIGQVPPAKRRRVWHVDLHRRFLHVMNTLGGPLGTATTKEIQDRMQVANLTEDEIKSHLLKYGLDIGCQARGPSPLPPSHNTCSMVGQDVLKMSRNVHSIWNRWMAAAANEENGGPKLVSEPHIHANGPMNNHM